MRAISMQNGRSRGNSAPVALVVLIVVAALVAAVSSWSQQQFAQRIELLESTGDAIGRTRDSIRDTDASLQDKVKNDAKIDEQYGEWIAKQREESQKLVHQENRLVEAKRWVEEGAGIITSRRQSLHERLAILTSPSASTTVPVASEPPHHGQQEQLRDELNRLQLIEGRLQHASQLVAEADASFRRLRELDQRLVRQLTEVQERQQQRRTRAERFATRLAESEQRCAEMDRQIRNEILRLRRHQASVAPR